MHLIMGNAEVRSLTIPCPPPEALECTCQLFSIPFRHDKKAGLFAAHPPLLGKRVIVRSVRPDRLTQDRLYSRFSAELRLLERLLWVSGADVTLEETLSSEDQSEQPRGPAYWDIALFVYPGQALPGCVEPLAVCSWWHGAFKSWRLAGCLAVGNGALSRSFKRVTTLRMAGDLKRWFSRSSKDIYAPAVLLSVPLIDGYVEQFLDTLSSTICQGVLRYFRKPLLTPLTIDVVNRAWEPEMVSVTMERSLARQIETISVVSADSGHPGISRPVLTSTKTPSAQDLKDSSEVSMSTPASRPSDPADKTAQQHSATSSDAPARTSDGPGKAGDAELYGLPSADGKAMAPESQRQPRPALLIQRGEMLSQVARQEQSRQTPTRGASSESSRSAGWAGPVPQPKDDNPEPRVLVSPRPSGRPDGSIHKQPQPMGSEMDEQMERLRRMLVEAPDMAAKQAAELLSKRGINPSKEMVDEYLQFLRRMLLRSEVESEGTEQG